MCEHERDSEGLMRELVLAAMNSPERLGDLLDCADCPDCARRVIEQFAFTFGGMIQDTVDHADDESLACTCESPLPAEVQAMRILFGLNAIGVSDDGATLRKALVDIANCQACNLDVHVAAARFQLNLLNRAEHSWHPQQNDLGTLEKHCLAILDQIE